MQYKMNGIQMHFQDILTGLPDYKDFELLREEQFLLWICSFLFQLFWYILTG